MEEYICVYKGVFLCQLGLRETKTTINKTKKLTKEKKKIKKKTPKNKRTNREN